MGFDLDMTLFDTRPGVAATYRAFVKETGVSIDVDLVVGRLGPPLAQEMAEWFPEDRVDWAVATFRSMYLDNAIEPSPLLPGAREAVEAVRSRGGRVAVITAKMGRFADVHLDYVGLTVDEVIGEAFAEGKERALKQVGATVYVGDHVADMRAATAVGSVVPVGVATGPCSPDDLREAGARYVLSDLGIFSDWLDGGEW